MSPIPPKELSVPTSSPVRTKRSRSQKMVDVLLNITLVATASLCLLAYKLPIFSPQLYAPNSSYNFGAVRAGVPVKHTFTVRNLHSWTIQVTGVSSDCGCTKSFVGRKVPFQLAPFQAVEVATSIDTTNKHGHISQNISVVLSHQSLTKLAISGTVN